VSEEVEGFEPELVPEVVEIRNVIVLLIAAVRWARRITGAARVDDQQLEVVRQVAEIAERRTRETGAAWMTDQQSPASRARVRDVAHRRPSTTRSTPAKSGVIVMPV
jgi:hypothetical protein